MSAAGGGAWGSARQDAHAKRENSCAGKPLLAAALIKRGGCIVSECVKKSMEIVKIVKL